MFDAIWTAALALNKTKSRLDARNLTFMDFNYNDKHGISNIIYEEALRVKFFGLTVSLKLQHRCVCVYIYVYMYICICICKNKSLPPVRYRK